MPGINAVLRAWHPMIGSDMHMPLPPGAPSPLPPVPYLTSALMMGMIPLVTTRVNITVFADSMCPVMVRGTDIGPMIPHGGPPSLTLPIEILTSGSKSHFGASKTQLKDQFGAQGPVAVGLLGLTNLNLNCGTPAPTPTGLVVAPTTHLAAMTLGDLISGLCLMGFDYVVQRVTFVIGQFLGNKVTKMIDVVAERLGAVALGRTAARQLARLLGTRANIGPVANALRAQAAVRAARIAVLRKVTDVGLVGVGLEIGSPLGLSVDNLRDPNHKSVLSRAEAPIDPEGNADKLGKAVDDYFDSPSAESVPATPEDAGAEGTSGGVNDDGGVGGTDAGTGTTEPDASMSAGGEETPPPTEPAGSEEPNMSTEPPPSDDEPNMSSRAQDGQPTTAPNATTNVSPESGPPDGGGSAPQDMSVDPSQQSSASQPSSAPSSSQTSSSVPTDQPETGTNMSTPDSPDEPDEGTSR